MSDEYLGFDEAVEHIMKATGRNRRQATAELKAAIRRGEIPSFLESETGEHEQIGPDYLPIEH